MSKCPFVPYGKRRANGCGDILRNVLKPDLFMGINPSDTTCTDGLYQFTTGSDGRGFTTLVRSVAAMPDDIRQSSIQHCSWDVEGNWWEWCTHANRNILRPCGCYCLSPSLSVSNQTGEMASSSYNSVGDHCALSSPLKCGSCACSSVTEPLLL